MAGILILLGVVTLACAAVVVVGLGASRFMTKRAPNSAFLFSVTPTGIALCACLVAVLVLGAVAKHLAPDSDLGSFLATRQGVIIGFGIAWLAFTIAATVLHVLGHPIFRVRGNRGV
jgi:predicted small integral membrane protein